MYSTYTSFVSAINARKSRKMKNCTTELLCERDKCTGRPGMWEKGPQKWQLHETWRRLQGSICKVSSFPPPSCCCPPPSLSRNDAGPSLLIKQLQRLPPLAYPHTPTSAGSPGSPSQFWRSAVSLMVEAAGPQLKNVYQKTSRGSSSDHWTDSISRGFNHALAWSLGKSIYP